MVHQSFQGNKKAPVASHQPLGYFGSTLNRQALGPAKCRPGQDRQPTIRLFSSKHLQLAWDRSASLAADYRGYGYPATTLRAREVRLDASLFATRSAAMQISPGVSSRHANPLAPLRRRDSAALAEVFEQDDIQANVLDIHHYLARIYPEPCWEDEPYEFLHGYL